MCGIFGYVGAREDAQKILVRGLERLEYRGYDSAGLAVGSDDGRIELHRSVGKVSCLAAKVENEAGKGPFRFGIAHTRWATHGGVTEENTHPHHGPAKKVWLVHNGILENHEKLRKRLASEGVSFYGQTDSEVAAKWLETRWKGTLLATVEAALPEFEGAYAFLIMDAGSPGELVAVKYGSPLVFGRGEDGGSYFASDSQALAGHVAEATFLDDGDLVHVAGGEAQVRSAGQRVSRASEKLKTETLLSDKEGYAHFMLKEIHEQPRVLAENLRGRLSPDGKTLVAEAFRGLDACRFDRVEFIACGTSYHAGMLGAHWMSDLAGTEASAHVASEFLNLPVPVGKRTLYAFVSQSGETADSLDPLKYLKSRGARTFGIVNVVGSSIARQTGVGLFTRAGAEVGVASTKAFVAQAECALMLALHFAEQNAADPRRARAAMEALPLLPAAAEAALAKSADLKRIGTELAKFQHLFFLGRSAALPVAHEAALKFKEITYRHASAMPLGELKHGTLALVDGDCPSVVFLPPDEHFARNKSSVAEIRARGGKVLAVSAQPVPEAEWNVVFPELGEIPFAFAATVACQLLAYHAADSLGREIDRPRNLAKSVTVK